jgi:hypothetical protein
MFNTDFLSVITTYVILISRDTCLMDDKRSETCTNKNGNR